MNRELSNLLAQCDPCGQPASGAWHHFLVLKNKGGIPAPDSQAPDFRWHRGFNVVLLDKRGRPVRYCKCRPGSDERLRYENAVLDALSPDPSLARIIPRTRGAAKGDLQIQVSVYVPGVVFESMLPGMNLARWKASTCEILMAACLVSDRARATLPRFRQSAAHISPFEAASQALAQLASWETDPENLRLLETVLRRTPPLPRSPQHGDLWPANVLRYEDAWWILDFEVFGKVEVPMYDVYHLVRTGMGSRESKAGASSWVDRMAQQDAAARCSRDVIRKMAGHYGLSREQAVGAAVFFIVHVAAAFRTSKKRTGVWRPLMAEVDRLAARLQAGSALDSMLLGPP